eukprot:3065689-Rhodomonas_salina.1
MHTRAQYRAHPYAYASSVPRQIAPYTTSVLYTTWHATTICCVSTGHRVSARREIGRLTPLAARPT